MALTFTDSDKWRVEKFEYKNEWTVCAPHRRVRITVDSWKIAWVLANYLAAWDKVTDMSEVITEAIFSDYTKRF